MSDSKNNLTTSAPTTFTQRIEQEHDIMKVYVQNAQQARAAIDDAEMDAIKELGDDYETARNSEVRQALIRRQLDDNDDYWEAKRALRGSQHLIEQQEIELKKLRMMIQNKQAISGLNLAHTLNQ